MDCDGSIMTQLDFGFLHLVNQIQEHMGGMRYALALLPLRELELPDDTAL